MKEAVPLMLSFIAHLHAYGSAPASIVSTISALAYFHKVLVGWSYAAR